MPRGASSQPPTPTATTLITIGPPPVKLTVSVCDNIVWLAKNARDTQCVYTFAMNVQAALPTAHIMYADPQAGVLHVSHVAFNGGEATLLRDVHEFLAQLDDKMDDKMEMATTPSTPGTPGTPATARPY